jgi:hypothetical protein
MNDLMDFSETRKLFNWRDHLRVHPAADLFPPLLPDELKALAEDIKVNGLKTPIVLWAELLEDSPVLVDGRNRLDALALLGWLGPARERALRERVKKHRRYINDNPLEIVDEVSDDCAVIAWDSSLLQTTYTGDVNALVLSLNAHRRHLTADQKRELIGKVLKAKPEQSNRSIAKQVKADDKTVASVRRDLETTAEIPQLEKTLGGDGKARKAKPAPKPAQTCNDDPQASSEARKAAYEIEVTVEDELEPVEYRDAFLLRAADAMAFAVYSGPIDDEVIAAAKRVAAKWQSFAETLETKTGVRKVAIGGRPDHQAAQ